MAVEIVLARPAEISLCFHLHGLHPTDSACGRCESTLACKRRAELPCDSLFTLLMAASASLTETAQFFRIQVINELRHHNPIFH